jgi:hypothetical protein
MATCIPKDLDDLADAVVASLIAKHRRPGVL